MKRMKKIVFHIITFGLIVVNALPARAQYTGGSGGSDRSAVSLAGAVISGGTITSIPAMAIIDGTVTYNNGGAATGIDTLVINSNSKLNLQGGGLALNANGKLRVLADESGGYGQLRILGNLNLNGGTFVQQQYATTTGWRNMGVPLDGNSTLAVFGAVNEAAAGATANTKNIKYWDAATSTWQDVTASDQIVPGRGYNVFIGNFGVQPSPGVVEVEGNPNGSITPALAYHDPGTSGSYASGTRDGWNFLANPFAASLDFDAIFGPPNSITNVEQAFYIWDPNTNVYFTYAGASAPNNDLTGYIPPMQGFWVRATAANPSMGTWSYQNHTVDTEQPIFLKTAAYAGHVLLEVKGEQEPNKHDKLTIALANEGATLGFDNGADARKLMNPETSLNFYTYANKQALAINAVTMPQSSVATMPMPLRLENTTAGKYYSVTLNPEYVPLGVKVYLEDAVLGEMHELTAGANTYSFKANANQAERFKVWFTTDPAWQPMPHYDELDAYTANNELRIEPGSYTGNGKVVVYDVCGKILYENTNIHLQAYTTTTIALPTRGGTVVLVRISTADTTLTLKSAQ